MIIVYALAAIGAMCMLSTMAIVTWAAFTPEDEFETNDWPDLKLYSQDQLSLLALDIEREIAERIK